MERILFANIGWMVHYRGNNTGDQIKGGGSYRDDDKHEAYNFLPIEGKYYGYVQPVRMSRINLDRISKEGDGERLDNVLVIWIARHPKAGGTYIVGWYKNATVYANFQDSRSSLRKKYGYNIVAKADDCTLVPLDQRTFKIHRARTDGKGFLGQSNIWYADSTEKAVLQFRKSVLDYVRSFTSTTKHFSPRAVTVDAKAKQRVEQAAVSYVRMEYQRLGYRVVSREKENIGWDLDAEINGATLKLEVKGLAQSRVSVHITKNEYDAMMSNKDSYRLCVVTDAIKKPMLITFYWEDSIKYWVSEEDSAIVLSIENKPYYLASVELKDSL